MAILMLLGLFAAAGTALADGAHYSSLNPLTEGWTVELGDGSAGGSVVAPDTDFPGVSSWQADAPASGTFRYHLDGPASTDSWTLRAHTRVVDLSEGLNDNVSLEVANGVMRWPATFGSNASGDTLISFSGAGSPTLDGAEVNTYGTSPLLFDTDGDGLGDGDEVAAGTDPLDNMDAPAVAVPALGGWGLVLLAGFLGAAGIRVSRARRTA